MVLLVDEAQDLNAATMQMVYNQVRARTYPAWISVSVGSAYGMALAVGLLAARPVAG